MKKENLINTLDTETQLRHANQAIKELTKENKELKAKINLSLGGVVPMLQKVHNMLEVDFDKQTPDNQEKMSKIVEMCEAIKDDYWMYMRLD